jgi:hypothetical protein
MNLRECTHVPQWIRYPGILLGESYNGIRMLADLFMIVKITTVMAALFGWATPDEHDL